MAMANRGAAARRREGGTAPTASIASAHGSAVYLHDSAQPSAHAAAFASPRDHRSYDSSSNPRTAHSLHAQPAMIISAGVNASAIAAHSPPIRRTTISAA